MGEFIIHVVCIILLLFLGNLIGFKAATEGYEKQINNTGTIMFDKTIYDCNSKGHLNAN